MFLKRFLNVFYVWNNVFSSMARSTLRARGPQSPDMLGDEKLMSSPGIFRWRLRSIPVSGARSATRRLRAPAVSRDYFTRLRTVQLEVVLLGPVL